MHSLQLFNDSSKKNRTISLDYVNILQTDITLKFDSRALIMDDQ